MTRHAVALLKSVYADVYPVNGQAVAFARKLWKVQDEDAVKDRSDHTHHAKDAMVIAALITIVPVCLIVLAILAAAGYFFIMR